MIPSFSLINQCADGPMQLGEGGKKHLTAACPCTLDNRERNLIHHASGGDNFLGNWKKLYRLTQETFEEN
jgi:hypothetical protein